MGHVVGMAPACHSVGLPLGSVTLTVWTVLAGYPVEYLTAWTRLNFISRSDGGYGFLESVPRRRGPSCPVAALIGPSALRCSLGAGHQVPSACQAGGPPSSPGGGVPTCGT